jgi:hypothetical protein
MASQKRLTRSGLERGRLGFGIAFAARATISLANVVASEPFRGSGSRPISGLPRRAFPTAFRRWCRRKRGTSFHRRPGRPVCNRSTRTIRPCLSSKTCQGKARDPERATACCCPMQFAVARPAFLARRSADDDHETRCGRARDRRRRPIAVRRWRSDPHLRTGQRRTRDHLDPL